MEPVSLVHPAAPAAAKPAGKTPRYLVRGDGVVLDYNPYLAKLPGFTPVDVLPPAHLAQIAAARGRDAALARALAALEPTPAPDAQPEEVPAQAPRARLVTVRASELPATPVVKQAAAKVEHGAAAAPASNSGTRVAEPVPAHAPVQVGPHEAEAIARARFRAQLKPVFERAGLAMDLRKPMETLRAEALATLKPSAAPPAAAKATAERASETRAPAATAAATKVS